MCVLDAAGLEESQMSGLRKKHKTSVAQEEWAGREVGGM